MNKIDWFNLTVQRIHNQPSAWRWWKLDAHDAPKGFTKIVGGVPVGIVSRGPRKGWPKWNTKASQTFFVADSDIVETKRLWSEQTGQCSNCCGTGQVFESWSRAEGTKTTGCVICGGKG